MTITDNLVTAFYTQFSELGSPTSKTFLEIYGPPSTDKPILICGAGATTDEYAIQLLELAGCTNVIATASTHNHEYLRSLGARHDRLQVARHGQAGHLCCERQGRTRHGLHQHREDAEKSSVGRTVECQGGTAVTCQGGGFGYDFPLPAGEYRSTVAIVVCLTRVSRTGI